MCKNTEIEELKRELSELKSMPLTICDIDITMRIEEINKKIREYENGTENN